MNLKHVLKLEQECELTRPLNYHQRTEQVLKEDFSLVKKQLTEIDEYARKHEMQINKKKTKIMLFNCSTQNDFQLEMSISDEKLECVISY